MSLYLDTSIVIPLFIDEPMSESATDWLVAQSRSAFLADLVVTEFNAAISRFVRTRRVREDQALAIRAQFDSWRPAATQALENLPADIRMAAELVQSALPKLLSADAIHLATCKRLGLTLGTYDADLRKVADREGVAWTCPT